MVILVLLALRMILGSSIAVIKDLGWLLLVDHLNVKRWLMAVISIPINFRLMRFGVG